MTKQIRHIRLKVVERVKRRASWLPTLLLLLFAAALSFFAAGSSIVGSNLGNDAKPNVALAACSTGVSKSGDPGTGYSTGQITFCPSVSTVTVCDYFTAVSGGCPGSIRLAELLTPSTYLQVAPR
jgi:hypothetical protein